MRSKILLVVLLLDVCVTVCTADDSKHFQLTLANHTGQLSWSADGYDNVHLSAKPNGKEIRVQAGNKNGITLIGVLVQLPEEEAPLSAATCRDGFLALEKYRDPTLEIDSRWERSNAGMLSISLVSYATSEGGKRVYAVRGFVAAADLCGDLGFYSNSPIGDEDSKLSEVFRTYKLDGEYSPTWRELLWYAQILYKDNMYAAAAPIYETALRKLAQGPETDVTTMRRVLIDEAGMSYGMSGDIQKSRSVFEKAIAEDPDYPLYYYNLACADAEEKDLLSARKHLRQAFDRKANVVRGERIPDPTTDDSFLPYRNNKEFWSFLESLRSER
jgi:tetratricopeptide (TPR) repeat protein